jgi:hypothetical protein
MWAPGHNRTLRALLACEESGRVREQFAKLGWEAWSADLLQADDAERIKTLPLEHHYQGDVRDLFRWDHPYNRQRKFERGDVPLWDLIIAFPPCTDLSYAGARWFPEKIADGRQARAMDFFMEMVNAPSPLVAVENPQGVPMRQYRQPDQKIQPWMFGDNFKKTTCLWLKGLPKLKPYTTVEPAASDLLITVSGGSRARGESWRPEWNRYEDSEGRKNRAKLRSRTFPGVAEAMAKQWAVFAEEYYG